MVKSSHASLAGLDHRGTRPPIDEGLGDLGSSGLVGQIATARASAANARRITSGTQIWIGQHPLGPQPLAVLPANLAALAAQARFLALSSVGEPPGWLAASMTASALVTCQW